MAAHRANWVMASLMVVLLSAFLFAGHAYANPVEEEIPSDAGIDVAVLTESDDAITSLQADEGEGVVLADENLVDENVQDEEPPSNSVALAANKTDGEEQLSQPLDNEVENEAGKTAESGPKQAETEANAVSQAEPDKSAELKVSSAKDADSKAASTEGTEPKAPSAKDANSEVVSTKSAEVKAVSTKSAESTKSVELKAASEPVLSVQGGGVIADGVYMISSAIKASARIEIGGASQSNGAGANVYTNNWTAAQRWYFTHLSGDYYSIKNVASGKYLDIAGAKVGNGARVQQYAGNSTKAQQWAVVKVGSSYKLYSALSSTYVLDLSGANTGNGTSVQLYKNNNTQAQRWKLEKIDPVLSNGLYTATVKSSNKALDVSGGSIYNSANVQQYTSNNTLAQDFYLSFNKKNGYYTVISSPSGLVLDVDGGSNSNGANVQLYAPNNTNAQKWAITKNSDGTYTLHSAVGGKVLDVSGASKKNGANVQVYGSNGTNAQKWTFKSAGAWSIPEGVYNIVTSVNQSNSLMVAKSSRGNNANVQTSSTSTTNWAQKWLFVKAGGGYYTIRDMNSRMMLDVAKTSASSGANVRQHTEGAAATQLWKPELTAGGIVFRSKANNKVVLDISGANTNVGANVQVYTSNGTVAQKFRVRSVDAIDSGKVMVFENLESGMVLDVSGASSANGAAVQLYESNGTGAQKFRVVSKSGNVYYLQNISSQKYLDVDTKTKTKLQQWEGQSGTDKQWEIALDKATGAFTVKSSYTGKYLDGTSGKLSLQAKKSSDAQKFALQPLPSFKVFLDAGHIVGQGGYDSGATGNGYVEADLTADLTDRIYKILVNEYGIDAVDGKSYGISYEKRTSKAVELGCNALVSIHFNAGGGSGYMTIVGGANRRNANSPELANIMHEHLGQSMSGLHNYGISTRDDLAIPNDSRIAATLLEVAFIDNSYDMSYYNSRRDTVAKSLAKGIYEASMRSAFN